MGRTFRGAGRQQAGRRARKNRVLRETRRSITKSSNLTSDPGRVAAWKTRPKNSKEE